MRQGRRVGPKGSQSRASADSVPGSGSRAEQLHSLPCLAWLQKVSENRGDKDTDSSFLSVPACATEAANTLVKGRFSISWLSYNKKNIPLEILIGFYGDRKIFSTPNKKSGSPECYPRSTRT